MSYTITHIYTRCIKNVMYSNKYNPIIIIITFNLLDKGIIEKVGYK